MNAILSGMVLQVSEHKKKPGIFFARLFQRGLKKNIDVVGIDPAIVLEGSTFHGLCDVNFWAFDKGGADFTANLIEQYSSVTTQPLKAAK